MRQGTRDSTVRNTGATPALMELTLCRVEGQMLRKYITWETTMMRVRQRFKTAVEIETVEAQISE